MGKFPDDAKVVSVSRIDKESDNKIKKNSNYRRVSVLNCLFILCATFIKMQQVPFHERQFSPFLVSTESRVIRNMC